MNLLSGLVDKKILSILNVFLENPDRFYHINKVAEESKVPLATTFRIMKTLLGEDIITVQTISKFKIYKLADNKRTKKLRRL